MPRSQPRTSSPSSVVSLALLAGVAGLLLGGNLLTSNPHAMLVVALVFTSGAGRALGHRWDAIAEGMARGVGRALRALFIFLLIGMLIGSWMLSGTIATLLDYGLELISPTWFLPLGLLVCSLVSLGTGTSWGTAGTIGIAFVGIGEGLGLPPGLVAGMVISGATFGDKMSPVSDTSNLAAAASGADLYAHIRAMAWTTLPTWLLCLGAYAALGVEAGQENFHPARIVQWQSSLREEFVIHWTLLLPMVLLFALSLRRTAPEPTMMAAIVLALVLGVIVQQASISEALACLNEGYVASTGLSDVDTLLSRGGMQSMMGTFSLAVLALALGGVLDQLGILRTLMTALLARVKRAASVVTACIVSGILGNMIVGESYLSIVLNGRLFQTAFRTGGLADRMLSRCLEEGATLSASLIPWTTAGAFMAGALGVSPLDYAPFAFLNWINPLVSIALSYGGWLIFRADAPPRPAV